MLTLYEPKYEDLWFRQMMLADEDTMSYNHAWGGTILWPEDKWSGWYDYWITCHEGKRYYRYLKNKDGQYVGEISYHYDAEIQHEIANVIIYSKYRKNGYNLEYDGNGTVFPVVIADGQGNTLTVRILTSYDKLPGETVFCNSLRLHFHQVNVGCQFFGF